MKYLGRYLKKPPIAGSWLAHYAGGATLSFRYHDHNTGGQATEILTQREIVACLKQHIPEKFFRMVRYFGFLANRVCGGLMVYRRAVAGLNVQELKIHARDISLMRYIPT